ncbi:hypothetical protein K466DRAFT_505373 [Polyporus arcularius HHB13444]|uniref:Uncharacterized protein n=1 Tax=Polyporus arcularius HHB13444 TaxID=1314778 RepID=A0A5C3NQL1_9APHY|nr:hypothetical protein K466DRAFT_505373 [Polyporus arcularius HHB13444]
MHLLALNLTELLIALFRATLICANTDDKAEWDWACFRDARVWEAHGAVVAEYARYLPGSFGHTPRNIAQKITSGYKAEEWMLYMYVINPGLLLRLLPRRYFLHFCRLVAGVRVACQRSVKIDQLRPAHEHLIQYVEQFEAWYYQRRLDRLHFVRPCIHLLVHLIPEIRDVGSAPTHSQYTMENYIGNITKEGNQHVTPQENIVQRAEIRVQEIGMQAMYPQLVHRTLDPASAVDLGDGFVLMRARERTQHNVQLHSEHVAIHSFLRRQNIPVRAEWIPRFQRWARLRLPTGQIGRTAWKECAWEAAGRVPRRARMLADNTYAEVQYYFQLMHEQKDLTLVMLAPYTTVDAELYEETFGVLSVCTPQPNKRRVLHIKQVAAVVAMFPFPESNKFYVGDKPGLDITPLQGYMEPDNELEEDDDIA